MGKRFGQQDDINHFAVELLDRLFLSKAEAISEVSDKNLTLFQLTCFLLSSKHDELDENIPQIKDLSRFFVRVLPSTRNPPSFDEVVECEREVLMYFNWDLMILIPAHFVRILLANGVVFENEANVN